MKKITNHERATKAAAARWGCARQKGVRIYIDEDAAALLHGMKPSEKRRVASAAIRNAVANGSFRTSV